MSKPTFTFVCLAVLALTNPVSRLLAGSTEDADRQFLSQLENGTAPQAAKAPAVPAITTVKPSAAPAEPAPRPPKATAAVKQTPDATKPSRKAPVSVQQPVEIAEIDPQPVTEGTSVTRFTVVRTTTPDTDRDRNQHHFFHRLFSHLLKDNNGHPEDW